MVIPPPGLCQGSLLVLRSASMAGTAVTCPVCGAELIGGYGGRLPIHEGARAPGLVPQTGSTFQDAGDGDSMNSSMSGSGGTARMP